MSHSLGLMIESLVAVLLVTTIGYCMLLNKRLTRLRSDEQSLKATISELITATEIAERAIGGLKLTVRECDQNLGGQLALAGEIADRLKKQSESGEQLLERLSRIVMASRPRHETSPEPAPDAQSIVAAARAFSDRARLRMSGAAA